MINKIISFMMILHISLMIYGETGIKLKNISVRDGLSNLNTSAIVQDSLGYVWIPTMNRLNR